MDQGTKGTPDWAVIRDEYEGRLFQPAVICRRHGISGMQLRYRREIEGWLTARARPPKRGELVARMLKVLEKQIRQLEAAVDEPIDKQVKALSESVKTLDILLKQGASQPNSVPASRKDITDLRAKLVKRLEQDAR